MIKCLRSNNMNELNKTLISVIVPVYNEREFLNRCVESIISQSYSNLEIVLIDDGSTDGSELLCDDLSKKDNRIIVFHKKNEGLICARKSGYLLSHGEYISFVDSDDWIDTNMIEEMASLSSECLADVVISGASFSYDSREFVKCNSVKPGIYREDDLKELKKKLFCGENYFSLPVLPYLWNKLWKRSVLEKNLLSVNDGITVGEDVAIGFQTILDSNCVAVTKESFYHYRQLESSMLNSGKDSDEEAKNARMLYDYLCDKASEKGYLDVLRSGLKRYCIHQLFTRAYEKINFKMGCKGCFPYADHIDKPLVIYAAGALGRAVYEYAKPRFKVKAWIDSNAEYISSLGYPVVTVDKADLNSDDIVIVAVFVERIAQEIKKTLSYRGVKEENIYLFNLSKDDEERLLSL